MTLGFIGLGKMGINLCLSLGEGGHRVIAWNRGEEGRKRGREAGVLVVNDLSELVSTLRPPRIIWLMVSSSGVDPLLRSLVPLLARGDMIIDGGNCYYLETFKRAQFLKKRGIKFLDAGVSGGPSGARRGACIMAGGDKAVYKKILPIIKAAAAPGAYDYFGSHGAGHFVKMVHNGIEYGMMQAIAEGFTLLRIAEVRGKKFKFNLKRIAELYNKRSVIESRLVGWLEGAYDKFGEELRKVSGKVAHTGEGEWTIKTAKKYGVPVKIIDESLKFRKRSSKRATYTGKILSALRNQFGGHAINGK